MSGDPGSQIRLPFDAAGHSRVGDRSGPAVWTAPGAMAAEAALLESLDAALDRRVGDPGTLRRPLRVVVPSLRLREHLNASLVRRRGRAVLGVQVQTLRALALEALERAGQAPPLGDALLPVLVRRRAAREPALRDLLAFEDGAAVVHASVRDFLDAGLEPGVHAEAADECLAELGGEAGAGCARAVVRVAAGVGADLDDLGVAHGASLLSRACQLLREEGPALLPTDAMWIHGFADATGLAAEWLEALVIVLGARAIVSVPPDPLGGPAGARSGSRFADPLIARLGGAGGTAPAPETSTPGRRSLEAWSAAGDAVEVRSVAARIRELLDGGSIPERIGVVARRLEPYRNVLHAQFSRLGIPFSAPGVEGPGDLVARRGRALVALLARGARLACDRWLDADVATAALHPRLRVALHVLGVRDVGDLAALELEGISVRGLALPMRVGGDDEGPLRRDRIGGDLLRRARRAARALLVELEAWPVEARFQVHLAAVERIVAALGWREDDAGAQRARHALELLAEQIPAAVELSREEVSVLVERAWTRTGSAGLGGSGAGVQVLPVMAARGRTFDHLFAIGMNRDVFPRPLTEDALVPDRLRDALRRAVLPELPVKARGREEERHLFADLLASSPRVSLTHQHASDDGRDRTPSPFLVRLGLEEAAVAGRPGVDPWDGPLALHERALRNALDGAPEQDGARADALAESCRALAGLCGCEVEPLARAQQAVLEELEPRRAAVRARLGPYFGFVLPPPAAEDGLYVTRLESLARCGWQSFLRRELGVEPVPDALEALPALGSLVLGSAVHAALERIVREAAPGAPRELAAAVEAGAFQVAWPDAEQLRRWVREEAERASLEEGIRAPLFVSALAARVEPIVARAREWLASPSAIGGLLGAELEGSVALSDGADRRTLRFRVDTVSVGPEGLRLTDYKTGGPVSRRKTEAGRRAEFARAIAEGRFLQAAAYQRGARQLPGVDRASGCFVFLGEAAPEAARVAAVDEGTPELAEAFEAATATLLDAYEAGVRPPRLVRVKEDSEPSACRWCEVSDACLRGDSGARLRLREWVARGPVGPGGPEDLGHRLYLAGRDAERGS